MKHLEYAMRSPEHMPVLSIPARNAGCTLGGKANDLTGHLTAEQGFKRLVDLF